MLWLSIIFQQIAGTVLEHAACNYFQTFLFDGIIFGLLVFAYNAISATKGVCSRIHSLPVITVASHRNFKLDIFARI